MTAAASEAGGKKRRKLDYKFWTLATLGGAVLAFNLAERLFLDADVNDISYARLIIPGNFVTNPKPGDVFVFNHDNNAFNESRFCSLQQPQPSEPVVDRLMASNLWGSSVNDTLASMEDYIGAKLAGLARVENAERHWTYSRMHRDEVLAPMEAACLQTVVAAALNPTLTPFVVDSVYQVDDADGTKNWVRFANPLMLEPDSCQGGCPQAKQLPDIVAPDWVTRFKADWGIVKVQ